MTVDTHHNRIPPVIFIHYGNSSYLFHTLALAVLAEPDRPVYLIGDDANNRYGFVRHCHYRDYTVSAFAFAESYLHLNGNHPTFELFCFQRWFVLRDFMLLHGIQQAIYLDSDIMLFDDLRQDLAAAADKPLALCGVAPPAIINDVAMLDTYCRFLEDAYATPENRERLRRHYQEMLAAGTVGGICDMTFWKMLRQQFPDSVFDLLAIPRSDSCHDRNIELSEGLAMEQGIKKIRWHNGKPYGYRDDGSTTRLKSLHMHGKGKQLVDAFFTNWQHSFSEHAENHAVETSPATQEIKEQSCRPIVLDAVFFQYRTTGIARVWQDILQQWAALPIASRLLILDRDNTCPRIPGLTYRTIPGHDYRNLSQDRLLLQQICDEVAARCFISTYYTTPVSTPSLLLIHDCIPEALKTDLRQPAWQEKAHAIEYAEAFCTVSGHTAADLFRYYPQTMGKPVAVIHNATSEIFRPAEAGEIAGFRINYGITRPYYFFVGPVEWYKNFRLLIEAFAQLPGNDRFQVVRTRREDGDFTHPLCADPQTVITTGRLSDTELSAAYSGALALVYPSWYEGFGLPVLEAMACGCPVIAADATAIPEVAGNAALLIDPHDREAMLNALIAVQAEGVRQKLRLAGFEQARRFSWKTSAARLQECLFRIGETP